MGGFTLYVSSLFPPYLTKDKIVLILKLTALTFLILVASSQFIYHLKRLDDDFK